MIYVLPPGVVCTVATHDPAYGNLDSNWGSVDRCRFEHWRGLLPKHLQTRIRVVAFDILLPLYSALYAIYFTRR
jgi:hypothetical protein